MRRVLALLGLMALVAAACDSAAPAETTTTTTEATTTTTRAPTTTTTTTQPPTTTTTTRPPIEWDYLPDDVAPVVEVLDQGAEPRQVIAYDLDVGASETLVLRQSVSTDQQIDGEASFSFSSDTSNEVTATVIDASVEGYTVEVVYGSWVVHETSGDASAIEAANEALAGSIEYSLISPSGRTVAIDAGDNSAFAQLASSGTVPFPTEPMGVGGQWRAVADIASLGLPIQQTTLVTIVGIEGSNVTLEYEVSQAFGDEPLEIPFLDVTSATLDSHGTSSIVVDLKAPPPPPLVASVSLDLELTIVVDGVESTLTQRSDNGLTVTPGPLVDTRPVIIGADLPLFPGGVTIDDSVTGLRPPNIEGFDFDGEPVTITTVDGRAKVIIFLAHWCPHCQYEVPLVTAWLEETGGVEGIDFYSVATAIDSTRDNYPPGDWLGREGWTVPVIVDDRNSTAYVAYGAGGFPFWVFLNSDGTVALRAVGEMEIDDLVDILESLE